MSEDMSHQVEDKRVCSCSGLCAQTLGLCVSVSGRLQEGRSGHPGQEDSAGGSAVSPAPGCPAGPAGLSAGPGIEIQLRYLCLLLLVLSSSSSPPLLLCSLLSFL